MFQERENRLLGSLGPQRREKVLKHLFKAKPMFEPPENLDLDPKNYTLVIGERIGYNFAGGSYIAPSGDSTVSSTRNTQSSSGPLQLWEYLKSLRDPNVKPRPTFYFPDHAAGPDLVFAFEPITPKVDKISERTLCVMQLKTAGTGVKVQKAIKTTDLSLSHLGRLSENAEPPPPQSDSRRRAFSDPPKKYDSKPVFMPKDTETNTNRMKEELQEFKKIYSEPQIAVSKDAESKHNKMEEELREWTGRTVIRILVSTQQESVPPEDVDAVKREQQKRPRTLNDHFVMFGKAPSRDGRNHPRPSNRRSDTDGRGENNDKDVDDDDDDAVAATTTTADAYAGDLFGEDFMELLERLKAKDTDAGKVEMATLEERAAKAAEREEAKVNREAMDPLEDGLDLFSVGRAISEVSSGEAPERKRTIDG